MDIKISSKFAIVILGIGIFSTLLAFDKSFPVESANAQMNMGGTAVLKVWMVVVVGGGGGGHGMAISGGSSGMGGGGAGHGMMMMTNVPGLRSTNMSYG